MRWTAAHVVPYDGVGGVETAARSISQVHYGDLDFWLVYIADNRRTHAGGESCSREFRPENDVRNYVAAVRRLLSLQPEIVICSLWRSCIVGLIFLALRRRTRLIVFLHAPVSVHFLDKIVTGVALFFAASIWADSNATLRRRVSPRNLSKARAISMLVAGSPTVARTNATPKFIFWGRLHQQKDLRRSLSIISLVRLSYPDASFTIIGPDAGEQSALEEACRELRLESSVEFVGPMGRAQIEAAAANCSFYLQTSRSEGMALSVVEAMRLGLVPIVTPVGEIAEYCKDGINSIIVRDDTVADRIVEVIQDPVHYRQLSSSAAHYWQETPLYIDSVLGACRQLMEK